MQAPFDSFSPRTSTSAETAPHRSDFELGSLQRLSHVSQSSIQSLAALSAGSEDDDADDRSGRRRPDSTLRRPSTERLIYQDSSEAYGASSPSQTRGFQLSDAGQGSPATADDRTESSSLIVPRARSRGRRSFDEGYEASSHQLNGSDDVDGGSSSVLLQLAAPPPFDLFISDLTIGLPPSSRSWRSFLPSFVATRLPPSARDGASASVAPSIVRHVSGQCKSGEVLALIGGSGSGKTSLLLALANRLGENLPILNGDVEFRESVRKSKRQSKAFKLNEQDGAKAVGKVMGFVRQQDTLLPHLTGSLYPPPAFLDLG